MDLHLTRPGVVAPSRIDLRGLTGPTPGQARGRSWVRVGPSLYRPADVADTVAQRIVEVVAAMPEGSAATGWAALHWQEARWFDGLAADGSRLPIPVAVGDRHAKRRFAGAKVSEDWLFAGDVMLVDGLPVTVPVRSVTYEARVARDDTGALQAIEMAAYDDLASVAELQAYTARLVSRPGKRRLEKALEVADENVWSPMEVVMRRWWQARVPRALLCNQPIFDLSGNHLFTPDLLDLEAGVAGEYDGKVHDTGPRRSKDLDRDELTRRLGIEVVRAMAGRGEESRFRRRLLGAYERADPDRPRPWTIEQPAWWVDTSTVARRRALSPTDRERWLGHRRTGQNGRDVA
ncbi:endonuclease domain-containing protein [Nocardioides daeguensis]|uniref:AbiEi antitoxin C-terminal domain-containing protein n=1 Tax=Nocardioides daeguensis TaxID=908359 RepID=A0ABP6V8I7_9ACTN|nr:endonuclease domain-containing protein [Nocardioides daeguensis]MBV6726190.1 endonuclease domain-containing protein [Nocardioides daeguensis]MCR1772033.1 endonuclease domain-containing protein [Nocardioides daeguensis]